MQKRTLIKKIKAIVAKFGEFSIGEVDNFDSAPVYKSFGKTGNQCIDFFGKRGVTVTTYVNEVESDEFIVDYEDLSTELLKEVFVIAEQYDAEQSKFFNSCKSENF